MKVLNAEYSIQGNTELLYRGWLSSVIHSAMTGTRTEILPRVHGIFLARDGFERGKFIRLIPNERIVLTRRTDEYPNWHPDSQLDITLQGRRDGSTMRLELSGVPDGLMAQETAWQVQRDRRMVHYFEATKPWDIWQILRDTSPLRNSPGADETTVMADLT